MDVHKSVNQFLIDAADAYINSLNGTELTLRDIEEQKKRNFITDVELENVRKELKEELLKEMVVLLGSAFAAGSRFAISRDASSNGE